MAIAETAEKGVKKIFSSLSLVQLLDLMEVFEFGSFDEILIEMVRDRAAEKGYCPECAVQLLVTVPMEFHGETAQCRHCDTTIQICKERG